LNLENRGQKSSVSQPLKTPGTASSVIEAAISLELRETGVTAYLDFDNVPFPGKTELWLTEPLNGELRSWLGEQARDLSKEGQTGNLAAVSAGDTSTEAVNQPALISSALLPVATAIVDDFAALLLAPGTIKKDTGSLALDTNAVTVSFAEDTEIREQYYY
jgi:hypothetical protein